MASSRKRAGHYFRELKGKEEKGQWGVSFFSSVKVGGSLLEKKKRIRRVKKFLFFDDSLGPVLVQGAVFFVFSNTKRGSVWFAFLLAR